MATEKSMIFKRKDVKAHGTKNMIEGVYKKDDKCLIIDDVITSGISIMETVDVRTYQYIRDACMCLILKLSYVI